MQCKFTRTLVVQTCFLQLLPTANGACNNEESCLKNLFYYNVTNVKQIKVSLSARKKYGNVTHSVVKFGTFSFFPLYF